MADSLPEPPRARAAPLGLPRAVDQEIHQEMKSVRVIDANKAERALSPQGSGVILLFVPERPLHMMDAAQEDPGFEILDLVQRLNNGDLAPT